MFVGEKVKYYREQKKISQRELGRRIGKSGQFISLIENGGSSPSIETLKSIADALDTSARNFIPDDEELNEKIVSSIYDYVNNYAVKNGKQFLLDEKYYTEWFEFVNNVQSLLENKVYKIELEIEKNNK